VLRFPGRSLKDLAGILHRMLAAVANQVQIPASAFAHYLLYGPGASSALDEHHPGDGPGPGQKEGSFSLQKVLAGKSVRKNVMTPR